LSPALDRVSAYRGDPPEDAHGFGCARRAGGHQRLRCDGDVPGFGYAHRRPHKRCDGIGIGVAEFLSGPESGRHEGVRVDKQLVSRSDACNPVFRPRPLRCRHPSPDRTALGRRIPGVCGRTPHDRARWSARPRDCGKRSRHWTATDFRGHQFNRSGIRGRPCPAQRSGL
jgi:hypothetical protein